ncbi:MAG TPA: hypothetical protein VMZ33_07575 [Candidatus Limnocylindrales bacterium]|nr:hypothetical protein [Candidatus Limnocylindrales bacterium]
MTCRLGSQTAADPDHVPADNVADPTLWTTGSNEPLSTSHVPTSLMATPAFYLRMEGMDQQFEFLFLESAVASQSPAC